MLIMDYESAQFVSTNLGPIVTTFGLILDIAGAFLIANELFNKISPDKQLRGVDWTWDGSSKLEDTDEGKLWSQGHYTKMKWGLILLTIGFALQAVGAWVP